MRYLDEIKAREAKQAMLLRAALEEKRPIQVHYLRTHKEASASLKKMLKNKGRK